MKKRIVALICVFTAVALMLCSCGGGTNGPDSEDVTPVYEDKAQQKIVKITLPYFGTDSINPYFAKSSENLALAYLYCQPLFEIKSDYSAEPVIAENYEYEGRNIYVTLKNVTFSDSSAVTPRDVVYSYEIAKDCPAFSQRLKNVEDAYMKGERVVFTLDTPDVLGINALCFPVVKFGSAWSEQLAPIGSGVFIFSEPEKMTLNPNAQLASEINTVELYDVTKPEYITHELEIGNFNFLFDDFSEGAYKRIVAANKAITLNSFVFLELNSGNPVLSSAAMRTAVYYAIDKQEVSATAYQGYSRATSVPFNPDLYLLKNVELADVKGNKQKCSEILSKLGYNYRNANDVLTNSVNSLELRLLVNSENSMRILAAYKIAGELNSQGFKVNVEAVDFGTYTARIAAGDFDMYLGEVKLTENMDLSAFSSGSASTGIDKTSTFFGAYTSFRNGNLDMPSMLDSFYDSMPFVPICYRMGLAAYSSEYTPDFSYAPFNIYGNIENWEASKQE